MVRSHASVRKGLGSIPEPDVTYGASYYLKMALALNPKFCSHSLVVLATHEQKLQIPNASQGKPFFLIKRESVPPTNECSCIVFKLYIYSFLAVV